MRIASGMLCVALLAGAPSFGLLACKDEKAAQRRALLKPKDMRAQRIVEHEKRQLFDAAGNLLESGELTAGVNMPKGLRLYRNFDNEWYLEARHIPMDALDRYFAARLDPLGIERNASSVTFADAIPRDTPKSRRVTIRVAKLIGSDTTCDIYVRQAVPTRSFPSTAQAEALIEAKRKHAE